MCACTSLPASPEPIQLLSLPLQFALLAPLPTKSLDLHMMSKCTLLMTSVHIKLIHASVLVLLPTQSPDLDSNDEQMHAANQ